MKADHLRGRGRLVAIAVAALATACTTAYADDAVTKAKEILEAGYKGSFTLPPASGPAAQKGKNIWYVSCGQAYVACVEEANGFAEAGEKLGWSVSVKDGKATPSIAADVIRLAVAAKVDGIAIAAFDCPGIKSALLLAKAEKIPVIAIQSVDCSDPAFGGEQSLFTATANLMGSPDPLEFYRKYGAARANYIIAKTDGNAKIVSINETSQLIHRSSTAGFKEVIETCKTCSVSKSDFTFSQVPNPAGQIWKSALVKNPDANVVEYAVDALMSLGLQTAVRQSARPDRLVGGGEGFPQNFDLIRNGTQSFSIVLPFTWFGWAMADTMNRILAGEDPKSLPDQGTGYQYVDKEHGLPAEGEGFVPPVDFKAAYLAVWNK